MEAVTLQTHILLWIAGFLSGFVDSIAGGGGLIALPALLSAGIPPHLALGTNKLQGSFGTLTATFNYSRNGLVGIQETVAGIVFTAVGAGLGTVAIQHLPGDILKHIIPVLLLTVFFYILLSPDLGSRDVRAQLPPAVFYCVFGLALGFYDGFFGPGTGSFWMVAFVLLLGVNLTKATARTKVMNFTSNIVALAFFLYGGHVLFSVGIVMGSGQMLGALAGSHLVVLKGTRFVRVFFLCVIALTILKLVVATYW